MVDSFFNTLNFSYIFNVSKNNENCLILRDNIIRVNIVNIRDTESESFEFINLLNFKTASWFLENA